MILTKHLQVHKNLKGACIFCAYIKHDNNEKLTPLQDEIVIQKIKNKCESKGDLKFKRKNWGFEILAGLGAKYHH